MLSVVIPTKDCERTLVPTLAALVSGALAGLVSEVLVADAGSRDDTAKVAEHAGCNFISVDGRLERRLNMAAAAARARWLLFLRPGTVLEASWTGDTERFLEHPQSGERAAVFRRGAPTGSGLRDALSFMATALGGRPRPEQGLLLSKDFHAALGGHPDSADPETALIRRIGRQRIVTLPTIAYPARYLT